MTRHIFVLLMAMLAAFCCAGCALTTSYHSTEADAVETQGKHTKADTGVLVETLRGEACAVNMLGLSFGDASVMAAATEGGISTIVTVDRSYFSVLSVYGKSCIIVTGE